MGLKCYKPDCQKGIDSGHALYRQNEKGIDPILACEEHSVIPIESDDIAKLIEKENHGTQSSQTR